MTKVLITGARGFIGRNLATRLATRDDVELFLFDIENANEQLREWLGAADVIFHLAGINRPKSDDEFKTGNADFTAEICDELRRAGRKPKVVMTSSIQAELDNPYGVSKCQAEEALKAFADETGAAVSIYRLKNVFGKWCRPNYNSVTATFCHNIAHDLEIQVNDPAREIELVYIDDVVEAIIGEMENPSGSPSCMAPDTLPSYAITLGDLAGRIQAFHDMRASLMTPDFSVRFNQCLYATYLSYVVPNGHEYGLDIKADDRGSLAEFIKSRHFGQIFVSRTRPGIMRGNHYHHTKIEKFFVIGGEGVIRMRHIDGDEVIEYRVRGEDYRIVDIPPGYTHSIENTGDSEMLTLFWASEVFDPDRPDTYFLQV